MPKLQKVTEAIRFAKEYARHPLQLGSPFRSNPKLIQTVIEAIPPATGHIIEFGPGDGVLTRELLNLGYRVTAVEINRIFYAKLTAWNEPNLKPVQGNISDLNSLISSGQITDADCLINGVPIGAIKDRDNFFMQTARITRGRYIHYSIQDLTKKLSKYFSKAESKKVGTRRVYIADMKDCIEEKVNATYKSC